MTQATSGWSFDAGDREAAAEHVAFAEFEAGRVDDLPDGVAERRLEHVAVVGAGTVGGGIAMALAHAQLTVTLLDLDTTALERGMARIRDHYAYGMQRGQLDAGSVARRLARIHPRSEWQAAEAADMVIEATPEYLGLKQEVFSRLDRITGAATILATHTAGLDVAAIASSTRRPADVIGTYFLGPVHSARLLEVVRTTHTAPDVVATVMALGRRLGKVSVLSRLNQGSIGNALLRPYRAEALALVEEGALPHEVDGALEAFGFAKGPFAVMDLAGLDMAQRSEWLALAAAPLAGGSDAASSEATMPGLRRSQLLGRLVERGRLGRASGRGWYRYEPGGRRPQRDPELEGALEAESLRLGIKRRRFTPEEILQRCLFAIVNEGARLLQRGVTQRASDIDIVAVTGYGFPAVQGGPMFMADRLGLPRVAAAVQKLRTERGPGWTPANLLLELAGRGAGFTSLQAPRR